MLFQRHRQKRVQVSTTWPSAEWTRTTGTVFSPYIYTADQKLAFLPDLFPLPSSKFKLDSQGLFMSHISGA